MIPRDRLDRSAAVLGLGAAASLLLTIADRAPLRLLTLGAIGVTVTLILAALAVAGGIFHLRALVILAATGFAAAVVLQVVQSSLDGTNTLGGNGSSVALHLAFAVGLFAIGSSSPAESAEGQ